MARILIATDAWHPQVNGVVRIIGTSIDHLLGSRVTEITRDKKIVIHHFQILDSEGKPEKASLR